jgi:hypothetical protein
MQFTVLKSSNVRRDSLFSFAFSSNQYQPLSCCLRARFWHAIKPLQYRSCLLNSSIEINWRPEFLLTQHPLGLQFNNYLNLHLIYTLIKRYLFINRKCLKTLEMSQSTVCTDKWHNSVCYQNTIRSNFRKLEIFSFPSLFILTKINLREATKVKESIQFNFHKSFRI